MIKLENLQGAIVHLKPKTRGGEPFADPAAHVFQTVDGLAWLNPGYFYPETAPLNNFHRIEAKLSADGDLVRFDGPDYSGYLEEWNGEIDQQKKVGDTLYLFESTLDQQNKTFASERAEILKTLGPELEQPLQSS